MAMESSAQAGATPSKQSKKAALFEKSAQKLL
jgi:hypothetical protein